jgi:hypothetical protein
MRLLSTLKPEQLAGIDVTGLLMPLMSTGDYRAVRAMRNLPPVALDHNRLDSAVYDGLAKGSTQYWFVRQYLEATGRANDWAKARPFFDNGFGLGDKARSQLGHAITNMPGKGKPDKAYVEDLLQRYQWSEGDAQRLKRSFGLK